MFVISQNRFCGFEANTSHMQITTRKYNTQKLLATASTKLANVRN